ncbi:DUF6191 domain-containing protein [Longivirga aurantiaca]|uniref:DUF6191 domain-containing protein n=1 Tax=Longivirga aurantiaca TaxID=1837743 RepID=A0ABW1SYS5_9ACTN
MTLPALVVLLIVVAVVDVVATRRRNARTGEKGRPKVAAAGFDVLGLALAPSTRHKREHDEFLEIKRDEDGDAAPPRSTVDLDSGVARIVLPPHDGTARDTSSNRRAHSRDSH